MFGSSTNFQYIDWWHEELPESDGEHEGTLSSVIPELNLNIGLTDNWNLEMAFTGGTRWMDFAGIPNIHHRDESVKGLGDTRITLRHLVLNEAFGPGERMFIGAGLIVPSKNSLDENPFNPDSTDPEHIHFSLSEGVYKTSVELQYFKRTHSSIFYGSVLRWTTPVTQNEYGFISGSQLDISVMAYLQSKSILKGMPFLTISGLFRTPDYWNGENTPNSGASILQIGVGEIWKVGNNVVSFSVRVAIIFTRGVAAEGQGGDIDSDAKAWFGGLSIRRSFDLEKLWPLMKEEHHQMDGHDH